ncbi:MAG: hypothetical protein DRO89_03935 [Candidatus Altiarchaeales archaeon]|nr:MAG: hypothetical protein DRO89_03935 [Candidatus Altiarchaeales archaeon]
MNFKIPQNAQNLGRNIAQDGKLEPVFWINYGKCQDRMCQPVVDVQLYTASEVLAFTTKPGEQLGEDIKPLH